VTPGERWLVTGVLGCIGAWTVRRLLRDGAEVTGFDLGDSRHRLELVLEPGELDRLDVVPGDVTDLAALERALDEREVTHVVHLAALQVPACRENPPLGAAVNVVGTVNVFEAARRRGLRVAYASSAAVYGAADAADEDPRTRPDTHYGVYKVANEGTARVYWQDNRLPSVGIRPYVVYGPGRDQGVTSTPTQAMLAAARGEAFRITFGGRTQMHHAHHADDVAGAFVAAARADVEGAHVVNMPGGETDMAGVVAAIEAAAPEAAGRIDYDDTALPFPPTLGTGAAERLLGPLPLTPLDAGVAATIDHFRRRSSRRT
jgi:nucleoside-diphosphate-sugar epimerase